MADEYSVSTLVAIVPPMALTILQIISVLVTEE
jgi:hypothetical protein